MDWREGGRLWRKEGGVGLTGCRLGVTRIADDRG